MVLTDTAAVSEVQGLSLGHSSTLEKIRLPVIITSIVKLKIHVS